jgi:glycosyltransferase involved in cell wall biosynthesis
MKIVGFSINPLFDDRVIGGSAKHQRNVLVRLGELGHQVTVLCTQHPESRRVFRWHDNVEVRPVLPFHQPFPQPYAIPAYRLATIAQTVNEALVDADRFYMHDGELLLPYLYRDIPTVISLRDNVYPETILGSFLFAAHRLIAIAEYSRQVYLHTAGRFLPELAERTVTINNGIDAALFKPGAVAAELRQLIAVNPDEHVIVLHPHRPEPSKGLEQTIAVAQLLVERYGLTQLRVLVPRWYDEAISAEVRAYYAGIEQRISALGLREHFVFHDWIPQRLMPDYYRLGQLTLVLGSFVEAFGNVAYESLACGTPAIVARVATHRSLLPDELIDKVHYGDNERAAELAAGIVRERRRTSAATAAYLAQHFAIDAQLNAYAELILTAERAGPPRYRPATQVERLGPAPWVYCWGDGWVFHDFEARHVRLPQFAALAAAHPQGWTQRDAAAAGVTAEQQQHWLADGYLTPRWEDGHERR